MSPSSLLATPLFRPHTSSCAAMVINVLCHSWSSVVPCRAAVLSPTLCGQADGSGPLCAGRPAPPVPKKTVGPPPASEHTHPLFLLIRQGWTEEVLGASSQRPIATPSTPHTSHSTSSQPSDSTVPSDQHFSCKQRLIVTQLTVTLPAQLTVTLPMCVCV